MRIIFKRLKIIICASLVFCLMFSVSKAVAPDNECSKYKVRYELLVDAMELVGVFSPDDTVAVWAKGLKTRNAAIQYSVMGHDLKKDFLRQLNENGSNWVTGMSSPWVESFQIINKEIQSKNKILFKLKIVTATSAGLADSYNALLTVCLENGFWRITNIRADEGLFPYMGVYVD